MARTSAVWRIFAELNNPKVRYRRLCELNIDGGKDVLAMFLNLELF